jgi:hypothetical protein
MKIDLDAFNSRVESGHIRKQTLDHLTIWNYTTRTQIERAWDEHTLLARGLITTRDGTIHSRSFKKFFNLGEPGVVLPENETPEITLKLDGFLGLTYWHEGKVKVASRGSFGSEYAQWATEWLRVNVPNCDRRFDPSYTYVFEILYPHRRIVVDNSGKYGLVMLAMIHTATGREADREFILDCMYHNGTTVVPLVEVYPTKTLDECVNLAKVMNGLDCEGFIAHYRESGIRVKIKGDDYCRIHKIATRLNARMVWEILVGWDNGRLDPPGEYDANLKIEEMALVLPQEYADWTRKRARELREAHDEICKDAYRTYFHMQNLGIFTRKEQVEYAQKHNPKMFHMIMAMIDGTKKYDHMAWKMVCPEHELPLARDGEDE